MTGYPVKDGAGNIIVGGDVGADQINKPGLRSVWKTSFSDVGANPYVDDLFRIICRGAGQSVSQSGGNLLIAAGTAVNEETIIRSKRAFNEGMILKYLLSLSQRIVNNTFAVELVDVVGDDLPLVINSAVSVTVTFPAGRNPFSAKNVGQSLYMGNFKGTAAMIPGRYAIASVAGGTVTFTVAGFPAAGQGSVSLYGWNYYHVLYDGTVNTNAKFDAGRNGWASGDTTVTGQTSAAPGQIGVVKIEDTRACFNDFLAASVAGGEQERIRATRDNMMPDPGTALYLQIRCTNGSVAPASTTTLTVGFVSIEDYTPEVVSVGSVLAQQEAAQIPVKPLNTQASGLFLAGTGRGASNNGGNPLYIATGNSANPAGVTAARNVDLHADLIGRINVQLGNIPQLQDQNRITLSTTTETTLIAAVASIRHGVHGLVIANRDTVATTVDFRDTTAGTVRHSVVIPAGQTVVVPFDFGWWQAAVNTNFTAALRAATTTNPVEISALSYRVPY